MALSGRGLAKLVLYFVLVVTAVVFRSFGGRFSCDFSDFDGSCFTIINTNYDWLSHTILYLYSFIAIYAFVTFIIYVIRTCRPRRLRFVNLIIENVINVLLLLATAVFFGIATYFWQKDGEIESIIPDSRTDSLVAFATGWIVVTELLGLLILTNVRDFWSPKEKTKEVDLEKGKDVQELQQQAAPEAWRAAATDTNPVA